MIQLNSIAVKEETKAEQALGLLALEINELECAAEAHNVRNQRLLRSIAECKASLNTLVAKYRSGKSNETVTCKLVNDQLENCKIIMVRISVL